MLSMRSLALVFLLPLSAYATKPQHAVWQSYADLAAGKCRSTSLTEDGILAASPATSKLVDLGVEEAWSVVARADGSILVGTAPEGKLLQVGKDGTVRTLAKLGESHLYALALGPKGETYVGSSPDGKIYTVSAEGKAQVYFDPGEKYIWALAVAADGTLFVGTGTKGKIFRVTARGAGELWYASNETHIRSLAVEKGGALLAGSAESGYLYRVTGKNEAVVLTGTGREEVNKIEVRPDGMIYFTATGTAKEAAAVKGAVAKKVVEDAGAAAGGAGSGMVSDLYRLNASLYPEVVWSTKDTVLSLTWSDSEGGALLGTAGDGYTYAVSPHGEATRLGRIDSDSVTAIAEAGGDAILATSNPGRLFRMSRAKSSPGIYESDVVDSGSFARWGAVTLKASEPGAVKIFTRSGNTMQPDKTWHEWMEASSGQAPSPPARYLQVQLQIGAGTVDRIDTCYLPRNEPPHLEAVKILPVGIGYVAAPASPMAPLPQSAAQLLAGPDPAESKTPMRYQSQDGHGLRTLIWKASDPNNDDLTYDVFWRKQGEADWHDLARNTLENLLTWDTSSWNEGRYELKVVASDANSNPVGEGLSDTAFSREMIVDNTPPVIQVTTQKADEVEFTVKDELSGLKSVTVSTDGKSYHPLVPVDGILDSGSEQFKAHLAAGQGLFIRAEDGSGNVAGAQTGK